MVELFDPTSRNPLLYLLPSYMTRIITVDTIALREKLKSIYESLHSSSHSDESVQTLKKFVESSLKIISE
jgi:hypothetical protein